MPGHRSARKGPVSPGVQEEGSPPGAHPLTHCRNEARHGPAIVERVEDDSLHAGGGEHRLAHLVCKHGVPTTHLVKPQPRRHVR